MPKRAVDYVVSSGNVFADLGLPNPEEALAKAELANKISVLIQERKLTQAKAAKLLGIDQPKVSMLLRGRLTGFSLERLMRFLLLLGQDIKITVQASPRKQTHARVLVVAAAEKIAAMQTEEFFSQRRSRADREAFRRILNRQGGKAPSSEDAWDNPVSL